MTTLFNQSAGQAIRPDPYIQISQWAEDKFMLPKESASEYGKYRISRTPFVKEPLDALSPMDPAQYVVTIKPAQTAGTTIGIIFLMCIADLYPAACQFYMPTDSKVKDLSKTRITPTVRLIASLKDKVKTDRSRDAGNTILAKEFPGGSWSFSGTNSAVAFRSKSAKYVILDDFDGFEIDVGGEGDPLELADRRTISFSGSKVYANSTPTIKGTSLIEIAFESTSQGYFSVPCPHCKEFQYLQFGGKDADFGIRFERDENGLVSDVWYQCEHCHNRIDEHQKIWMMERGKYIHKHPERILSRGFKWNALYTPVGWKNTWTKITTDFIRAAQLLKQGQAGKMKTWMNTIMAESWEESGERPEWDILSQRCEQYEIGFVPEGGKLLTCGVDTMDSHLILVVKAWGRGEENWLVYPTELWGDPDQPEVWERLDQIINAGYQHESGRVLRVESVCVDSQGHRTQAVYNYCRKRFPRVVAIQGASRPGRPVIGRPTEQDVTWGGETIKKGAQLWPVGTDTAKATIYSRLNMAGQGAGVYHWPENTPDDYFKQLTAEKLVTKYVRGYPKQEWTIEQGRANHYLDCNVYAYAAAVRAGMGRPGFWDEVEKPHRTSSHVREDREKSNFLSQGSGFLPNTDNFLG